VAEPKQLPPGEAPVPEVVVIGDATYRYQREDYFVTAKVVTDMTREAAEAMVKVAEHQFATPAIELTRRDRIKYYSVAI